MAQKKKATRRNSNRGKKIVLATTVAALAAVAGAYFLYGTKEGAQQRRRIKGWALRMKGEVLERLENLKEVNEEVYNKVVDTVAKRYRGFKNADARELTALVRELKSHWNNLRRQFETGQRTPPRRKK